MKLGKSNIIVAVLKSKLKILHSYWERMDNDNIALGIMGEIESTDYYQQDDYLEAANAYSAAGGSIEEQIQALEPPSQATGSGDAHKVRWKGGAARPKIELSFDGSLEKWRKFRGIQLDDSRGHHLSNAEKMHYLVSALQGAALEVIDSCVANPDMYELRSSK